MEQQAAHRRSTWRDLEASDASSRALLLFLRPRLRRGARRDEVAASDPGAAPGRLRPPDRSGGARLGRRRAAALPALRRPAVPRAIRARGRAAARAVEEGQLAEVSRSSRGRSVSMDRTAALLCGVFAGWRAGRWLRRRI